MKRISFLIYFCITLSVFASTTDKAFEALRIFDYFRAKKLFYSSLKKEPTAASFGLALIYFRQDNPFHHPDSATKYIRRALSSFTSEYPKKKERFAGWKITEVGLKSLKEEIYRHIFDRTVAANTLPSYELFIAGFADALQFPDAIAKRDSLAFNGVLKIDSWEAYREFMEKYPLSKEYPNAVRLYELRLFSSWTQSGTLKSFDSFLEKFPSSPHAPDAENAIFGLSTSGGTIDEYYLFIRKHPANRNVEQAWYNIYTLYTTDFKPESFNDFLKVFPDYPYSENVNKDIELSRLILLPVRQNNKWGYIDTSGKTVIPCIYEWCEDFSEGLAAVGLNGKAGFINKAGLQVFPFEFEEADNFSDGFAEVTLNGKSGVVRRTGKQVIPCEYDEIDFEYIHQLISLKKNGKYGFMDLNGALVIPFQFDKVSSFYFGLAGAEMNGKWGFISTKGEWKIPATYDWVSKFGKEGFATVKSGGRTGLVSRSGQLLIPCKYQFIGNYSEGLFLAEDSVHYGFVDSTGKIVIPFTFEKAPFADLTTGFMNGLARGYKKGKVGLIDRKGKFLIPYDFEEILLDSGEPDLFIVKKNGRYGLIDRKAKMLIPAQYENFLMFVNGRARVSREEDGEWGLIAKNKKVLIPLSFDDIFPNVTGSVYIVELDEKFGLYSADGTKLLDTVYDEIGTGADYLPLEKDKKISWFNISTGKIIWTEE